MKFETYERILSQASLNFNGSSIEVMETTSKGKGKHCATKYSKSSKKRSVNNNRNDYSGSKNNNNDNRNGCNCSYNCGNNEEVNLNEKRLSNIKGIEHAIIIMKRRLECGDNDLNEERTKKSIKALEHVVMRMRKRLEKEGISKEEIANLDEIESFVNNIKMMIKDEKH